MRLILTAVLVCGTACSTTMESTWKKPGAKPFDFKKVAVIAAVTEDSMRRQMEDLIVNELGSDRAVPSYTIVPGALPDRAAIDRATHFAIAHGADFVKTSTGKIEVSATPEAAEIVLEAIEVSGMPVGFKASGGVKTLADARIYIELAERIMGPGWVSPETFRFGASGLLDALLAVAGERR